MAARYEIIRQIASGGMAEVLLARRVDDGGEQLVVLKRVLPHLSSEDAFLSMFRREARLASDLRHPNIVRVLEVGELDGLPFIAMERLDGADLLRLLQQCALRRQPLGTAAALAIVAGAARGLGHAHRARGKDGRALRIIHRDVSPHNLFVTRDGGVKLLDFGIAKSAAQVGLTGTGQVKGKISYIAPEQIRALPTDSRSDLWSLGVVLWEAVAGEKLFTRDNDAATLHAILQDPVPALGRSEAPGLDELIAAILQRDPDQRIGTAEEIAHYLDAILAAMRVTQPERVLAQRVASLIPASDPSRDVARPSQPKAAEVILASSRAPVQQPLRGDTRPPALYDDKTQTEVGFDPSEHTTAVETNIPDDERTVAMSIPPEPAAAPTVTPLAGAGGRAPVRHPRLSLEEPATIPARRAPTMSMPPVARRPAEPQRQATMAPTRPSLPPERPSSRPPPTLPPERKRAASVVAPEPPAPRPPPPRAPEPPAPPPTSPPAAAQPRMSPAPQPPAPFAQPTQPPTPFAQPTPPRGPAEDPFGPLPFHPPQPAPMQVPVIAPMMAHPSPHASFAPHPAMGGYGPRGDTLAAAEIPRMVSLPPARPKSRGTAWLVGIGSICLLGSALLLGTMGRRVTPSTPTGAANSPAAVAAPSVPVVAPAPTVAAPSVPVAAPAPTVAAPPAPVAAPSPSVAALPAPVAAPSPNVAAPSPNVAATPIPVATPIPSVGAPPQNAASAPPAVAAPAPRVTAPPAPRVASSPPPRAAPVAPRPAPVAAAARPAPGLAPDPFAPRPVATRPAATPTRAQSPIPLDLLPPRPAAATAPTARRPPRVIDRTSGLTNDPFDTVHGTAPAAGATSRPAPTPPRAAPAPSARGSQIFTDL